MTSQNIPITKKINYGSGENYKEGWINIDINENNKVDLIINSTQTDLPFKDNSIDYILMDNVAEHIYPEQLLKLLLEFHRILKPTGEIEIYSPHFTSIARKYLEHVKSFGIDSFYLIQDKFNIEQDLLLISRYGGQRINLQLLNKLNFLFNFSNVWKQICEKIFVFGFEEIHFKLKKKVQKKN